MQAAMVHAGDTMGGNNIKLHGGLKTGFSNSEKPAKQGDDFYMKD